MSTRIDQLLHGYRRGHERLAGSIKLPAKDAELVARLSDLSGTPTGSATFAPYFTAYPLPNGSHFAIGQTWPDIHAARSGCVLTHTLLIPTAYWRTLGAPQDARALFQNPVDRPNDDAYDKPLAWPGDPSGVARHERALSSSASAKLVQLYFAEGKRPVVWFGHPDAGNAFWRILAALWPALRARFAVCTHCLQPRTLDDRPFDLMFAATEAYPRFLKVDRANLIEYESGKSSPHVDDWSRRWSQRIFGDSGADDVLDADLFNDLDDDPTAIRRLYLIDSAIRSESSAPQAAVGAMDLVESVARQPNLGLGTKAEVARRAVAIAGAAKNALDGLESLRLIEDRLKRPAFSRIAGQIGPLLVNAVAERAASDPELVAQMPVIPYEIGSESESSWYGKGLLLGFQQLANRGDSGLAALRSLPHITAKLFATEPSSVAAYIHALVVRREESTVRQSIHELLAGNFDQASLLRRSILDDFKPSDVALVGDLLKGVAAIEVPDILEAIFPFLSDEAVGTAVDHVIVRDYPEQVRSWAFSKHSWPDDITRLVAATFPTSRQGLGQLLDVKIPPDRHGPILVEYLMPLARGRFPAWVRQMACDDQRVFATLLSLSAGHSNDSLVSQLLSECEDVHLAHFPSVLCALAGQQSRSYYPQLLDSCLSDLLRGYLDGTIPESDSVAVLQSPSAGNWISAKGDDELKSLLTHQVWNRRENWLNAWRLLLLVPGTLYTREPSVLYDAIDALLRAYYQPWSSVVAHSWSSILQKASKDCASPRLRLLLEVQAFKYAIKNSRFPLSEVVVVTFTDIYRAVTSSPTAPQETSSLFGMFDWDKGKELRKELIDTFMSSQWPPGDLALASTDTELFRKIFKRIHRKSTGPRYLQAMSADLQTRTTPEAKRMAGTLASLLRDPDFYEEWD